METTVWWAEKLRGGTSDSQVCLLHNCLFKIFYYCYCSSGSVYPRTILSLKQRAALHEITWIIPTADCILFFELSQLNQSVLIKYGADKCHSAVAKYIVVLLCYDTRCFPHILTLKYTLLRPLVFRGFKASLICVITQCHSLIAPMNVMRIINSTSFWFKKLTCH